MLQEVDVLIYTLGGWQAPLGIELRIDALSVLLLLILSGSASLVSIYALKSVEKEIAEGKQVLFYSAFLLVMAGLIGISITGDAFNVFVFLEISSLSTYAIISMGKDRRALHASYQYLIMGTIGATFILIGIAFLYVMTGTLNMNDLAQRIPAVADTSAIRAAFAFITIGVGIKAAMLPLHQWLPNAYAYSPSVVSTFLAATATKVAVYVMIRFELTIFGIEFSLLEMPFDKILMILGTLGILGGSIYAIYQSNVKRMLAYSSIAQIGYMLLAIGLASHPGFTAALLHMFNHALIKGSLFMALGIVFFRYASTELSVMSGIGKTMPLTMAAFTIGGLSLIGVPGTAGFVSKWYLVTALLDASLWPIALLILVASVLTLIYVGRVIEVAYFRPAPEGTTQKKVPATMIVTLWIFALSNIYFGLNIDISLGISSLAVDQIIGVRP
ncbi:monovalent cation/H+ antiporter subunit D family protein [Arcobacter sp. LA11]|uniref:monovalent cation/H+ antiporter subunit D family protein n=1 Tax=Arcobacter sp. LA11 TaxID=1898176 RepID=UPI002159F2ED|nr:monovalent cation/H+ antiporter subunit D family protein [Arcobacter sp. LA11]